MHSTRAQRTTLFAELYDELFRRVSDHPGLTRRDTEECSRRAVAARMNILRPHLAGVKTFMEIASGDCRLAYEMCQHVEKVIALDISDQSGGQQNAPRSSVSSLRTTRATRRSPARPSANTRRG